MTAPFEERDGWEMTAVPLDGSVYIELHDPPDVRQKRQVVSPAELISGKKIRVRGRGKHTWATPSNRTRQYLRVDLIGRKEIQKGGLGM